MFRLSNSFHPITPFENINNNRLKGKGVMPHKDMPSDNENTFSMIRHEYLRTVPPISLYPNEHSIASRSLNVQPPFSRLRPNTVPEKTKKWYGNSSNRISSRVTEHKKMLEVGKSSLNLNPQRTLGFTKNNDTNVLDRALIRVRRMGGAAPPKTNI
jgi:hypothetical protein